MGDEPPRSDDGGSREHRRCRHRLEQRAVGRREEDQVDYYGDRFVGTNLKNPDFAEVARAMGAQGIKVEKASEIGNAVKTAVASGKPTVINLVVDSVELAEPFRRDALKKPVRMLDVYKHLTG